MAPWWTAKESWGTAKDFRGPREAAFACSTHCVVSLTYITVDVCFPSKYINDSIYSSLLGENDSKKYTVGDRHVN